MANINQPDFDELREHDGYRARRARISRQAGAERLGLSLWELPCGEASYPFHFHHTEEEMVLVLEGRPSLRTSVGWRDLEEGEVVSFLRGADGAHQLFNATEQTVRFLSFSTSGEPDIVIYPDSGKLGAFERLPQGGGLRFFSGWPRRSTTTTASRHPSRKEVLARRGAAPELRSNVTACCAGQPRQQPGGGPLACFDCSVEEPDVGDRRVLAGEQDPALRTPGDRAVARGLSDPVVGVGALYPRVEGPMVLVGEAGEGGRHPGDDRLELAQGQRTSAAGARRGLPR